MYSAPVFCILHFCIHYINDAEIRDRRARRPQRRAVDSCADHGAPTFRQRKMKLGVLALLLGPVTAAPNNPERSFMAWMLADANATPAAWAARIANLKAHAETYWFGGSVNVPAL